MNTRSILLLLMTLFIGRGVATAQTPQQWRDSLSVLNGMIRLSPRSTDLRLKKAALNIELNQWEYAVEEYGRVLEMDAKNLAALYFRAYANVHLCRYDMAKYDYETFLSIQPKHFEAQLGLAMVKRNMGRKTDALDELNRLVQLFPDSVYAYVARASYEAELQQYEVALFDWDEVICRQPLNADYVASKVQLLLQLKRYDEAWKELEQAMKRGIPRVALKEWIDKCK